MRSEEIKEKSLALKSVANQCNRSLGALLGRMWPLSTAGGIVPRVSFFSAILTLVVANRRQIRIDASELLISIPPHPQLFN